jgi:hypothetical protein
LRQLTVGRASSANRADLDVSVKDQPSFLLRPKNRQRLSAQIAEYEQAVARHEAAAKQATRDDDDAELDRAEIALRAARPHRIVTRIDGWLVDPENESRIPAAVAE